MNGGREKRLKEQTELQESRACLDCENRLIHFLPDDTACRAPKIHSIQVSLKRTRRIIQII